MYYAYIFMIVFGSILVCLSLLLFISSDPRNSFLLARVHGLNRMTQDEAKKAAKEIACAVGGVGLALVVFFLIQLIREANIIMV